MIALALNHIWQSTLFAAVIASLVLALRRYPANVRFWLWMSASFKFLIPFALLAGLGSHLALHEVHAAQPITPQPAETLTKLAQPFVLSDATAMQFSPLSEAPSRTAAETWAPRLFVLWLAGFAAVLGYWLWQMLRLASIRRAAQKADGDLGNLPIPVLFTESSVELGVLGIFRPVLLLPNSIVERLTPGQLQTVIAHELVHVRRRDNLWAAIHALVQAIFWFNPIVWWMGSQLVAEREQACDEAVLAQGADAEGYAAGILAVCRHYACTPQPFLSGVAGADLKQRIVAIMQFGRVRHSSRIRLALAALAVAAIATPIVLGHAYGQTSQETPKLAFDVASIREWSSNQGPTGAYMVGVKYLKGQIQAQCAPLASFISYAYQLTGSEPVEGMPKWGHAACGVLDFSDTFSLEARMPPETTQAQSRLMMQTLLAERFKVVVHWETRQLPVYELRVISTGFKLKVSDPDKDPPLAEPLSCPADDPHCHFGSCCGSETMTAFTGSMTFNMGRPVISKTGLTGPYNFGVWKWAGDDSSGSSLPSLFTALRDNFGLELKPATGPVPVLIIDHAEKPTAN